MFFEKNAISVGYEFMKMLKIFDKIDEVQSRRVISGSQMTLRLCTSSILSNIFNIFVNLYPMLVAFFQKASAIAVATLLVDKWYVLLNRLECAIDGKTVNGDKW
jgi:hypothetical protein